VTFLPVASHLAWMARTVATVKALPKWSLDLSMIALWGPPA
jgi:hypothetical protein